MFLSSQILPSVRHDDHTSRVFNKSRWLAKFTGYFMWTCHLHTFTQVYSVMSVFCWNTLIFTPECWKYILRGPVFKFFPEACAFSAPKHFPHVFSFSTYSKAFATYLILLTTLYRSPRTAILKLKIYWLLHVIERNWKLISVMYVPEITFVLFL